MIYGISYAYFVENHSIQSYVHLSKRRKTKHFSGSKLDQNDREGYILDKSWARPLILEVSSLTVTVSLTVLDKSTKFHFGTFVEKI